MTQFYSDPDRADDPHALPDCETFYLARSSYFELPDEETAEEGDAPNLTVLGAGWYWQACFPGCLPDGDPIGPFETEAEAIADAQDGAS